MVVHLVAGVIVAFPRALFVLLATHGVTSAPIPFVVVTMA
jgi:hypothetical protein